MSQEKDKLLDHSYDGIQEYDNPLPRWWLWMFYGTIIFSVIYFPYFHMFGGKLPLDEYAEEMAQAQALRAKQEAQIAAAQQAQQQAAASDASGTSAAAAPVVAGGNSDAGKGIYTQYCLACHGAAGEGGIGPNLTDNFWIHGNTTADLVKTVTEGVPAKGMVPWKSTLSPTKINDVVAFIETLKGTNPPNAKAPEGTEYPE